MRAGQTEEGEPEDREETGRKLREAARSPVGGIKDLWAGGLDL